MVKDAFKSKLDGNELDLSLMSLDEVPVKEIASIPKATSIDLSCNRLISIPESFGSLKQIVKLDLSRNSIITLPRSFGDLVKLQFLDLCDNKTLPVSFSQLKNLKWLDLKNNPLTQHLKVVAGDCLEAKQCQSCAKNVVAFMQNVQLELALEQVKKQKQKEELEALRKIEEERMLEKKRKAKKTAKLKKAAALLAEKQRKDALAQRVPENQNDSTATEKPRNSELVTKVKDNFDSGKNGTMSLIHKVLLLLTITTSFGLGLLYFYTGGKLTSSNTLQAVSMLTADVLVLCAMFSKSFRKF